MTVKRLGLYLAIFSLLYMVNFLAIATSYGWLIGQNRIVNTDFENDEVGQPPVEWALEKAVEAVMQASIAWK